MQPTEHVWEEPNEDDDVEYECTADDIKILEERRQKRLSGESKSYSWEEAKEMIIGKRRMQKNNDESN